MRRNFIRRWLCRHGRHGYEAFTDQFNVGMCPHCGVVRRAPGKKAMRYTDRSR